MKKLLVTLIAVCMVLGTVIAASGAAGVSFVLPEDAVIVVGGEAESYEKAAATELQSLIEKVSGVRHEIVTDAGLPDVFVISVGSTSLASAKDDGKTDGSFIISPIFRTRSAAAAQVTEVSAVPGGQQTGENPSEPVTETPEKPAAEDIDGLAIVGYGARGLIYGVYRFMYEFGGCRWYTSGLGMTTDRTYVSVPVGFGGITYDCSFEYTDTDWRSPRDTVYSLANGLNGGPYRSISSQYGGTVNYIAGLCHTLATKFCSRDKYFDEHPEYFALHDGQRVNKQLCLTNEEVYKTVKEEVFALLKESHDPGAAIQIVSLTQDDNQEFCECEACKALDDANGSHAGTMITFVNRIAKDVKEAGYDNVLIDTFAYQYTRTPPTAVVPEDNVIVRLCSIECCFSHALDDPSCEDNVSFANDIKVWSGICDRLYIWDYTTNYSQTLGVFPDFAVLKDNIRFFRENSVKGIYEEGNYYIDACDTEFGELRAYLLSRLLLDPERDIDAETLGFLKTYYGDANGYIKDIIDMYSLNAAKRHVHIGEPMKDSLDFSDDEVAAIDALWEKALAECETDAQRSNVERSRISWRYWKACAGKGEFAGVFKGADARKQLRDDILASGATKSSEGSDPPIRFNLFYRFLPANSWFGSGKPVDYIVAVIAVLMMLAVIIISAVVFVRAAKSRRPMLLLAFPEALALAAAYALNCWLFLDWNPVGYGATILLIGVIVFAAVLTLFYKKGGNVRKWCAYSGVFAALHMIVHIAVQSVIHMAVFHIKRPLLAICITYVCCLALDLLLVLLMLRKASKPREASPEPAAQPDAAQTVSEAAPEEVPEEAAQPVPPTAPEAVPEGIGEYVPGPVSGETGAAEVPDSPADGDGGASF